MWKMWKIKMKNNITNIYFYKSLCYNLRKDEREENANEKSKRNHTYDSCCDNRNYDDYDWNHIV